MEIQILASFWLLFHHSQYAYSWPENQPRIQAENRNILIIGAQDRNISLTASAVNANSKDIGRTLKLAKAAFLNIRNSEKELLAEFQSTSMMIKENINGRILRFEKKLSFFENETLVDRYRTMFNNSVNAMARFKHKIRTLKLRIQLKKILFNRCRWVGCFEGGTCINTYGGMHCICPPNWKGSRCEQDVDECAQFNGTDLGCQNGATCTNLEGSYQCSCPVGWFGVHCTKRTFDCTASNAAEMCGHGICVNQGGTGKGFACICDQGWKVPDGNQTSVSCIQDVDECASKVSPCSANPPVHCINTPGSFQCGQCPEGYSGNGYQCRDIDECLVNNGGCSLEPKVICVNQRGSRLCGPCPPGYSGNGENCVLVDNLCQINNGGCNSMSSCIYNSGMNEVVCQCPRGLSGSGIGPNGCISDPSAIDGCDSSPCLNEGSCQSMRNADFKCLCTPLFFGKVCQLKHTSCTTNPCQNGGTCEIDDPSSNYTSNFFCRCADGFGGTHCEFVENECAETFTKADGTLSRKIKYQEYHKQSKVSQTCSWTIETSSSMALKISFTKFNYPGDSIECSSKDQLSIKIFDGLAMNARLVGEYCGSKQLPPSFVSSHNAVHIISEGFVTQDVEFSFNWTTTNKVCGGWIYFLSHGVLSSPGYPGPYPANSDCIWTLATIPGHRIQYTFLFIDIEQSPNCTNDFLEVWTNNRYYNRPRALRKFCNSTTPTPFLTFRSKGRIHFHSDSHFGGKGFKLAYMKVAGIPGCGGVLTAPEGQIISPDWSWWLCFWEIRLHEGEKIRLDWSGPLYTIFVYEGPLIEVDRSLDGGSPLEKISLRRQMISKSNYLTISTNMSGLSMNQKAQGTLKYKSVCDEVFTDASGVIQSISYPSHYLPNRVCTYRIESPSETAISVTFLDFDVEEAEEAEEEAEEECFDKLEVFDGNSESFPSLGKFCGKLKPFVITSTHNHLLLKFSTDNTIGRRGFYANYSTIPLPCGGVYEYELGSIVARDIEKHECLWIISASKGECVRLDWQYFDSSSCNSQITVYDGVLRPDAKHILGKEKYCGEGLPSPILSSSHLLLIQLKTNLPQNGKVFNVTYAINETLYHNDFNYYSSSGTIKSPNYPEDYNNFAQVYTYKITVEEGKQIRLLFHDFVLEDEPESDYLEIRNGGTENAPLIGVYYGSKIPIKVIRSHSNKLFLKFVTNVAVAKRGFKLTWDSLSYGCGGDLKTSTGEIMSPNYPNPYGRVGECSWRISTSSGSTLRLIIYDLDLARSCQQNYLTIFDGHHRTDKTLGTSCNLNGSTVVNSTTNHLYIVLTANSYDQGRGFHLVYETDCHRVLSGLGGAIESLNFPLWDGDSNCLWTIAAPKGNKIKLSMSYIKIQAYFAYLKITEGTEDGQATNQIMKWQFDTQENKTEFTSQLDRVFVSFVTNNEYNDKNGFRLEWKASECGGIFRGQEKGEISSPNYPRRFNGSIVCEWLISVQPGHSIVLIFDDVYVESRTIYNACSYDSVHIYGGENDKAPLLATICDDILQSNPHFIVPTSGNLAFVRIHSLSKDNKRFHARFSTKISGCGGEFVSPKGQVHSLNYPQPYSKGINCLYEITSGKHFGIRVNFSNFDIPSDANCSTSYVEVFNSYESFGKFCNQMKPKEIVSTENSISIRHFVSAENLTPNGKGFLAKYDSTCGRHIISKSDRGGSLFRGYLNLSKYFLFGTKCIWVISSEKETSKVTLTFTSLVLTPPYVSQTEPTFIAIHAGHGESAPWYKNITGNKIPPPIIVPSSTATIVFHLLFDTSFNMDYSFLDNACGGAYNAAEGKVVSPNFPELYPNNIACEWTINLSPGNTMSLQFSTMKIQESSNCNEDYLEIRREGRTGTLVGIFCGTLIPPVIHSNSSLWIYFRSSEHVVAEGFELDFVLDHGGILTGDFGQIGSPLYPARYEGSEIDFKWKIQVDSGSVIRLTLVEFAFSRFPGQSTLCYASELKIFNGYNEDAPLLATVCVLDPTPIVSDTNVIFIQYRTDYSSRFLLNWEKIDRKPPKSFNKIDDPCNSKVFLSQTNDGNATYNFTSPGYPNGYANNLNCNWTIETEPQNHIEIKFNTISFENNFCFADYLTLYNLDDAPHSVIGKYCHANQTGISISGGRAVTVNFQSDVLQNGSGFSATAQIRCGGRISGTSEGRITLPKSENSFRSCVWYIVAKPGKMLNIKLTKFRILPQLPSCSNGYLMLRNGGYPDSPYLGAGKYCGTKAPDALTTSSNKVYIEFDQTAANQEIEILYKTFSLDCNNEIHLTEGLRESENISSPNYPNVPSPHTECTWIFLSQPGTSIHFQLEERFDMTIDEGCKLEYLELREGTSEMSELIGRYCNEGPSFIVTKGNVLFVKYFTGVPAPRDGFRAVVSLSKCGGNFIEQKSGTMTSPNYPKLYDSELNCTWTLRGGTPWIRYSIEIEVLEIRPEMIKPAKNLTKDDPQLGVHLDLFEPQIEKRLAWVYFSHDKIGKLIISDTSEIEISLTSLVAERFLIRFKEIDLISQCGGELHFESGEIKSPGYLPFPNKVVCTWDINAPLGKKVTLRFVDNDIPFSSHINASLTIRYFPDYHFMESRISSREVKNIEIGTVFRSEGNYMRIVFICENCSSYRGFRAEYTTTEPTDCGGYLDENGGSLTYLKKDNNDPYECTWELKKSKSSRTITFSVPGRTVNSNYRPCQSVIGIYSVYRNYRSCDLTTNEQISILTWDSAVIKFEQFTTVQSTNFTFSWNTSECGGYLSSPTSLISPGFPSGYAPGLDCLWIFNFENKVKLQITFDSFDLDSKSNDYLEIRYNNYNPLVGNYRGKDVPKAVTTDTNDQFSVHFHTDQSQESAGFNISFKPTVQVCGEYIIGEFNGTFASPSYPDFYTNNLECEWEIRVMTGYRIRVEFTDRLQIEQSPSCTHDFVRFSDYVNSTWVPIAQVCGRNYEQPINSTSSRMKILFRTNENTTGTGFKLNWKLFCGGVFNAEEGTKSFYSPSYFLGNGRRCNYSIVAPGKLIKIHLNVFNLEKDVNGECVSYAEITTFSRYYGRTRLNKKTKLCGTTTITPDIISSEKFLLAYVRNDAKLFLPHRSHSGGFDLEYAIEGCGDKVTTPSKLSLPPTNFESLKCKWDIIAPQDHVVLIRISGMQMIVTKMCKDDYIKIWEGGVSSENKTILNTLCGSIQGRTSTFRTKTNEAVLELFALHSEWIGHLKIVIDFAYGKNKDCGGSVKLLDSNHKNVVFGSSSVQKGVNFDCHWTVSAPPGNIIFFKVATSFSTSGTFEIYDGLSSIDELIYQTNKTTRASRMSSKNYASIVFSFRAGESPTFYVQLEAHISPCGPSVLNVTDTPKYLTSPNYPKPSPTNVNCVWQLVSDENDIAIFLETVDLHESEGCTSDRLEIEDNADKVRRRNLAGSDLDSTYVVGGDRHIVDHIQKFFSDINKLVFCSKEKQFSINLMSSNVQIKFVSDFQFFRSGFKLKYQKHNACNETYIGTQGHIVATVVFRRCLIQIFPLPTSSNLSISIYFSKTPLPYAGGPEKCDENVLKVFEGNNTQEDNMIYKRCVGTLPSPIFSASKGLTIYINTHSSYKTTLDLTYTTTDKGLGCGGKISGARGAFTSPLFPNNVRNDSTCEWLIVAPRGNILVLNFKVFDFGSLNTCSTDHVEIYSVGMNNQQSMIGTYCSQNPPNKIKGNTASMLVRYTSSVHNGGIGFSATFGIECKQSSSWFLLCFNTFCFVETEQASD